MQPVPRPAICFLFTLLVAALPAAAVPPTVDLGGSWAINEDQSDDIDDVFEDKLRSLPRRPPPIGLQDGRRPSRSEAAQQGYWDTLARSRERSAKKNLRRLGTAYPLLLTDTLDIEADGDGFTFTYDETLPRQVRPNAEGRVYTASGDELVVDTIGYTLSFWDQRTLVLETDPPNGGGRFVERIELSPDRQQLIYSVRLDLRVLTETVTVKRVFDRRDG